LSISLRFPHQTEGCRSPCFLSPNILGLTCLPLLLLQGEAWQKFSHEKLLELVPAILVSFFPWSI
jgi:hypothetical protein